MLAMLMMRPLPRGLMRRSASRVAWNVPFRCTASMRAQRSSVMRCVASSGVVTRPVVVISCTWRSSRASVSGSASA